VDENMRRILSGLALTLISVPAWAQTIGENRSHCDSRDPDISIAGCTALIQSGQETSPGNQSVAYYNRGSAYYFKGLLDQSLADFNKAVTLSSSDPNIYLGRGTVYFKKVYTIRPSPITRKRSRSGPIAPMLTKFGA
jgi:tetratricopeptide (TPR) repeat protein